MTKRTLFVSGQSTYANLTGLHQHLYDLLVADGFTGLDDTPGAIDLRAASNANKDTTGYDVVVLASDTSSSALLGYLESTAGLVILAHAVWDDAKMWTGGSFATTGSTQNLQVVTDTHPIIQDAGVAGTFQAYSVPGNVRTVSTVNMGGGAVVLARWPDLPAGSSSVAVWAFEDGALLADGVTVAPGRRVAGPPLNEASDPAGSWIGTTALEDLFVSMVAWASGNEGSEPGPIIVSDLQVGVTPDGAPVRARYWNAATGAWEG